MFRKRKGVFFFVLIVFGVIAFLLVYCGRISGDKLFEYIQMDNITQITIQKTIDNSALIENFGSFDLTQSEIERFYKIVSDSQLKDIGQQSFAINTEVRYFVFFGNSEGYTEGTMKFYEDEVLIFDYVYGDRPAIHKRYLVVSSSFKDFFESIILLNTEG